MNETTFWSWPCQYYYREFSQLSAAEILTFVEEVFGMPGLPPPDDDLIDGLVEVIMERRQKGTMTGSQINRIMDRLT